MVLGHAEVVTKTLNKKVRIKFLTTKLHDWADHSKTLTLLIRNSVFVRTWKAKKRKVSIFIKILFGFILIIRHYGLKTGPKL